MSTSERNTVRVKHSQPRPEKRIYMCSPEKSRGYFCYSGTVLQGRPPRYRLRHWLRPPQAVNQDLLQSALSIQSETDTRDGRTLTPLHSTRAFPWIRRQMETCPARTPGCYAPHDQLRFLGFVRASGWLRGSRPAAAIFAIKWGLSIAI